MRWRPSGTLSWPPLGQPVPASVHLDHATGEALVREAIALGFSSVMFDASTLGYQDNVKATADVVRLCHDSGVWVEAELGEVGGKDGVHAPGPVPTPPKPPLTSRPPAWMRWP